MNYSSNFLPSLTLPYLIMSFRDTILSLEPFLFCFSVEEDATRQKGLPLSFEMHHTASAPGTFGDKCGVAKETGRDRMGSLVEALARRSLILPRREKRRGEEKKRGEKKREEKRGVCGEQQLRLSEKRSFELCLGLFTLLCQEKGAVSSWKSGSLFCHTGLLCLHSSLKDREGLRNTVWFKPHTAAVVKLLLFEHYNTCSYHPDSALFSFWNFSLCGQQFLTTFWPQMVCFCSLYLHKLLGRRSVISRIVKGLPRGVSLHIWLC